VWIYFRTFRLKSQEGKIKCSLPPANRQWLAAGTVFSEARSRGIIAGMAEEGVRK
jgi:hypothetical protein